MDNLQRAQIARDIRSLAKTFKAAPIGVDQPGVSMSEQSSARAEQEQTLHIAAEALEGGSPASFVSELLWLLEPPMSEVGLAASLKQIRGSLEA